MGKQLPEKSKISTIASPKRAGKDGITIKLVKEIMGLPADTPDDFKINNDEWNKKLGPWLACRAYQEWEDKTITGYHKNAFKVLDAEPHPKVARVIMITYVPATGGKRRIGDDVEKMRRRRRSWPYYFLSEELEGQGVALIRDLPGCPTEKDVCPHCNKRLFFNESSLLNYLSEFVLEKLIIDKIKLYRIPWLKSHVRCERMVEWERKYRASKRALGTQLKLGKKMSVSDTQKRQSEFDVEWARKGHEMINWLRRAGYITSPRQADELRAEVDKITNTNTKSKTLAKKAPKKRSA